jgi:hypothetical protein
VSARGSRLTAALTGRGREVGPVEAHERNVLLLAAQITRRQTRMRELARELKRLRSEQRRQRRELRQVLQRVPEAPSEAVQEAAGHADAADAAIASAERRPLDAAPFADMPESPKRDAMLDRWRRQS